jgi:hypothetical protein
MRSCRNIVGLSFIIMKLVLTYKKRATHEGLMAGDFVKEKNGYLHLETGILLNTFTEEFAQQLFKEFTLFLKHFMASKQAFSQGKQVEAHRLIFIAVQHWARISVIEEGKIPDRTIWRQVRNTDAGIIPLIKELTSTTETLEQRIRLAYLACDFSVMSRLKHFCLPILRVMSCRAEPWSLKELSDHPQLKVFQSELHMILKKLARRSYIHELFIVSDNQLKSLEIRYSVDPWDPS